MSFCACHNLLNSYDLSYLMGKMNLIHSGFVQVEINHKRYERSTDQGLPKIRSPTSIGSRSLSSQVAGAVVSSFVLRFLAMFHVDSQQGVGVVSLSVTCW